MPGVGSGFLGIQIQDGSTLLGRAYGWMGYLIAETSGKRFVLSVIQMLVTEEQDFIFQQGLINKLERLGTDITAQFNAFKLCTNSTRHGFYLNSHYATPASRVVVDRS